jgi:ketosteroid isomerase-like protein
VINERGRKKLALEHSRRLSAGDLDGLLGLYAADATFEDPVGVGGVTGHEALRAHFESAVAGNVSETLEESVVGQDGAHVLARITAVMDYRPLGPEYLGHGWLPAPDGAEPTGLRRHYALLLRVGESGLIEAGQAYWGRGDIETSADGRSGPFHGPTTPPPGELVLRQMPDTYTRMVNEGNVEGVLDLFTDDVVFEDPVGRTMLRGREAVRQHLVFATQAKAHEVPGRPVTSMDGRFVVGPADVRVHAPEEMYFRLITISELNEAGLGVHLRAFWGLTDMTMGLPAGDSGPKDRKGPLKQPRTPS